MQDLNQNVISGDKGENDGQIQPSRRAFGEIFTPTTIFMVTRIGIAFHLWCALGDRKSYFWANAYITVISFCERNHAYMMNE
jgi:hypothetical protein